ncbi:MAG: tetratricopeptide repeat protein [Armatimonas sp.]
MLEKFEQRLALEARKPDREARHLSLRAAIGWSVDLLTPELRRLFYALSVFRGGFTAEVAGEVADVEGIHDGLTRLREQSLLVADLSGDVARFSLPEAIREFAEEQLREETRERHAAWAYREGDAVKLGIEEDANVRAALQFLRDRGRIGEFMRLTGRYAFTWFRAGHLQEGQEALETALALDSEELAYTNRLPVYRIRGAFHHFRQDGEGARLAAAACIALAEANGDEVTVATMMMDSATTLLVARRFEEALVQLQEVLPRVQALGRTEDHSACLNNMGICAIELGQWEQARQWLTQAITVTQSDTARFRHGLALDLMARLARCEGNLLQAVDLLEQAEAAMRADNHEFYLVFVLQNHAVVRALLRIPAAYAKLAECLPIQKTTGSDEGWLDIAEALLFVKGLEGTLTPTEVSLLGACEALRGERELLPRLRVEAQNWQELIRRGRVLLGDTAFESRFAAGRELALTALVEALDKVMEIR